MGSREWFWDGDLGVLPGTYPQVRGLQANHQYKPANHQYEPANHQYKPAFLQKLLYPLLLQKLLCCIYPLVLTPLQFTDGQNALAATGLNQINATCWAAVYTEFMLILIHLSEAKVIRTTLLFRVQFGGDCL